MPSRSRAAGDGVPRKAASTGGSVINLVNNIIGAGALPLPWAIRMASFVPGMMILVLICGANTYAFILIGRCCALAGQATFQGVGTRAFGLRWGRVVQTLMLLFSMGTGIGHIDVIGDFIPHTFAYLRPESYFTNRVAVILTFAACVLFPLSSLRDLNNLRYTSLGAVTFICFALGLLVVREVQYGHINPSTKWSDFRWPDLFVAWPLMCVAFTAHYNAPRYFSELRQGGPGDADGSEAGPARITTVGGPAGEGSAVADGDGGGGARGAAARALGRLGMGPAGGGSAGAEYTPVRAEAPPSYDEVMMGGADAAIAHLDGASASGDDGALDGGDGVELTRRRTVGTVGSGEWLSESDDEAGAGGGASARERARRAGRGAGHGGALAVVAPPHGASIDEAALRGDELPPGSVGPMPRAVPVALSPSLDAMAADVGAGAEVVTPGGGRGDRAGSDAGFAAVAEDGEELAGVDMRPECVTPEDAAAVSAFSRVVVLSTGSCLLLFILCGTAGVFRFGDQVDGNILDNLRNDDTAAIIARVGLALAVSCAYPLVLNCMRNALIAVCGMGGPGLPPVSTRRRLGLTALLVSCTVIVALLVPKIEVVFAFKGAILGSFIVYILPSLMYLRLCRIVARADLVRVPGAGVSWAHTLPPVMLAVFGVLSACFGTYGAIMHANGDAKGNEGNSEAFED